MFHRDLNGANLHNSKITHYNGNPNGNVEATVIGEMCIDIVTEAIYTATATGTGSWVSIGGIGGVPTHANLTGLQGGTTAEYYHLTNAQHDTLTDGSDAASLHIHSVPEQNVIYVSKQGNDGTATGGEEAPYLTVKAALDSITGNTEDNAFMVKVGPGFYSEDNPVTLPQYVTLYAEGDIITNRITATNLSTPLFVSEGFNAIVGLTLRAAADDIAISHADADPSIYKDILFIEGGGIHVNNAATTVTLENITALTYVNPMDVVFQCSAGKMNIRNFGTIGDSEIATVLLATGANSTVHTFSTLTYSTNVTNGFVAESSSKIHATNAIFRGSQYPLRARTSAELVGSGAYVHPSNDVTYTIWQEDATAKITLDAGEMNSDKFNVTDWDLVDIRYTDPSEGRITSVSSMDFSVGQPEQGRRVYFGEGRDDSRGMMVYTFDGAVFTDVTTEAASVTASTFTFGTGLNNGVYFSSDLFTPSKSDYFKFYGVETKITAATVLGGGSYVWEFWNGSSWQDLPVMVVDGASPYYPHADATFEDTGVDNVRFCGVALQDWAKNDPITSGTSRYWVRFRVASTITTAPVIESITLHPSHMLTNDDGWVEYYGLTRPVARLPWDISLVKAGDASPVDQVVYLSDFLDVGRTENLFSNTATDRIALCSYLPYEADTSCPIRFQWSWRTGTGGGDVRWVVRWSYSTDGDSIYATSAAAPTNDSKEQSVTAIETGVSAGVQITQSVDLRISSMVSRRNGAFGDLIWISLEREGGHVDDTNTGDVALINIAPYFSKWCEGGHL